MTHTPGPWAENLVAGSADGAREVREPMPGGKSRRIATVFGFNELEAELNARLIAAAPELAEALRDAADKFLRIRDSALIDSAEASIAQAGLEHARALLARLEGGQK